MSSSTKPKDGSAPKNGRAKELSIQRIIKKLTDLLNRLSDTKKAFDRQATKDKGSTETQDVGQNDHGEKPSTGADDGSQKEGGDVKPSTEAASTEPDDGGQKKGGDVVKGGAQSRTEANDEMEVHTQLDKVCKELNYIISAFKKLEKFETDISEPLKTLESNVNDIQADLEGGASISDTVKEQVERNLKVLRGNITKVKIQIPLQHQVSASTSDKYLQTTVASKEAGHLPTPYEAKEIFESSCFVKEFRDHYYKGLDDRLKLCLLCFAIFPEDAEVKKRLLKFWWVGERLSPEPDDSKKKSQKKQSKSSDNQQQEPKQGQKEEQQPKSSDNQQQGTNQAQKEEQQPKSSGNRQQDTKQEQKEEQQPKNQQQDTKQAQKEEQQPKSLDNQQQETKQEQKEEKQPKNQQQEEKLGKFVDETLKQFVKMGFIEPVTKKSKSPPTSYKMHPIVRSLIIKFAKEANFFDYDPKGKPTMNISVSKKSCLTKSESKTEGKSEVTTPWFSKIYLEPKSSDKQSKDKKQDQEDEKQRTEKQKQKQNPEKEMERQRKKQEQEDEKKRAKEEKQRQTDLEQLQTLFNVSKQFPDLPEELFSKMRNIGVLYLGRWESTAERHMEVEATKFLKGLENMKKLRFFSLQGISGISNFKKPLGKSLDKLSNLRILDLRACHNLEELPKEIGSLSRLTHLDLSECYLLDKMPKDLSKLPQLKILKGFVVSKNSSCALADLAALHELEKLSINVNDDSFSINKEGVVFSKFKLLKKLKIAWGSGGEGSKQKNGKNGEEKKPENGAEKKQKNGKNGENKRPENGAEKKPKNEKNGENSAAPKQGLFDQLKLKPWGGTKPDSNQNEKAQEIRLTKLDLQCFPGREPPNWLLPKNLTSLKRLYIKGGELSNLGESLMQGDNEKWKVEILRLKFLTNIKTSWKQLQTQFPKLEYLEKVNCPQITFCPCDANGVWITKKQQQP
ncbi:hypothetical protein PTKIN_Ptkin05aG0006200 [Pterospermum kingtungense]